MSDIPGNPVKLMATTMARIDGILNPRDTWREYRISAILAIEAINAMTDAERAAFLLPATRADYTRHTLSALTPETEG